MTDFVDVEAAAIDAMRGRDPNEPVDMINLLKFRQTVVDGLGIGVDGRSGENVYYRRYGAGVNRLFERLGLSTQVIWGWHNVHATIIGLPGEEWDAMAIARYSTRAEFLAMIDDPEDVELRRIRSASLSNSRLIESVSSRPANYPASTDSPVPVSIVVGPTRDPLADPRTRDLAERPSDEPVYMLNLLRCREWALDGAGVDGLDGGSAYEAYVSGLLDSDVGRRAGLEEVWRGYPVENIVGPADEQWDLGLLIRYPTRRQFVEMTRSEEYRSQHGTVRAAAVCDSRLIETTPL